MHKHAKPAGSSSIKGSAGAGFSSGDLAEKWSTSSLPEVVVRIHFTVAVRLRAQASCWLWAKGHLQLLETFLSSLSEGPSNIATYYCKASRERTSSKAESYLTESNHSNDISHLCHVRLFRNKLQVCLHSREWDYTKTWTPLFRWGIMGLTLECQPQMGRKGKKKKGARRKEKYKEKEDVLMYT